MNPGQPPELRQPQVGGSDRGSGPWRRLRLVREAAGGNRWSFEFDSEAGEIYTIDMVQPLGAPIAVKASLERRLAPS